MPKILIIEDERPIREMLRSFLESEGYDVMDAADGKIGSRICHSEHVDLVITDIFMPEKEGLELIRELKQDFPRLKMIAISGGGTMEGIGPAARNFLAIAEKFGVDFTFEKPFEMEMLLSAVKELTEKVETGV